MEVITGPCHTAFPVDEASRVGEVRRHAARLAADMAWDDVQAGRLALVVTELCTNLLRHAQKGRLLIAARPAAGQIELLAIDHGPGIANVQKCMADGYSSGTTPGTGFGAIRRLAQEFDIHSSVPEGTLVVARLHKNPPDPNAPAPRRRIEVGAVCVPAPGETVSGDAWSVCVDGAQAAVMVADGLGHGPLAEEASLAALNVFHRAPFAGLAQNLNQAHAELRSTRGAAVCHMRLDADTATLTSLGAGNIATRVVSGVFDRSLLTQHGTVGMQIRHPEEASMPWPPHAMAILHSDGISTRWPPQPLHPVMACDPVLVAALLLRDHCRGRDDATVVVLRRGTLA